MTVYNHISQDWEERPIEATIPTDWDHRTSSIGVTQNSYTPPINIPPIIPGRNTASTPPPMRPNAEYLAAQHGWSEDGNRRNWTVLLVLSAILLALVIAIGFAVQRLNLLPAGVPLIGKDSGVAACEAMAAGRKPVERSGEAMSAKEYRAVRGVFADSSYPAIRDNGVRMVDLAYQLQGLEATDLVAALTYVQPLTQAYAGLTGGCAAVGYTIPALGK